MKTEDKKYWLNEYGERYWYKREKLNKLSFLYIIDYDSNSQVAEDHYERCANDYCRCSTLHPTINSFDYKEIANHIIESFKIKNEKTKNDILDVCSTLAIDDFECNVCGGYYGEEMDSITISNSIILRKLDEVIDIQTARKNKLSKIDIVSGRVFIDDVKVKNILVREYGYLLDDMKNAKFSVIEIDTKDIVFPQKNYSKNLSVTKVSGYKNHQGICGVVRMKGGKYHVVDGYHRITANLSKPRIKVILYS